MVPSVAGLSPDELLRIAANPEATKRRYDKLRKQQAAAAKATEELAAARSEFDARVERTQAELVAKSASLQKEKAELFVAKNKFEETAERARNIIAEQTRVANIGRFKQVGPTLIQEFTPGYPRGDGEEDDPHYPTSHVEAVPDGRGLTRSVNEARRRPGRPRRSAEL